MTKESVLQQDVGVKYGIECTLEYNMNTLIDNIKVTSNTPDTDYINGINWTYVDKDGNTQTINKKLNPFKKLFPVDAIIKPFRPIYPGVKYYINSTYDTPSGGWYDYRKPVYKGEGANYLSTTGAKPRVYFPGVSASYKYWLGAKNKDVSVSVDYYTDETTGKLALTNKIVLKFESSHTLPSKYTVSIKLDGSTSYIKIVDNQNVPAVGNIVLAYNGTSWDQYDGASSGINGYIYATPIYIKSIKVEATNPKTNENYIGITEISARWVRDVSQDLVSMEVQKTMSSNSSEGILPVGMATSNSLTVELAKYYTVAPLIKEYIRETTSFHASYIFLTKGVQVKPYSIIYNDGGAYGMSGNKYDRIPQGTYFMDSYGVSQFGDASITCLDGSKFLAETFCPDLLCENFPVTAILRNLLDSVGFTNYNFNLLYDANDATKLIDTSIAQVQKWWTEDTKTVWEAIQELCRDIQMNAIFDDNNILQFYSRDYIYDKSRMPIKWAFTHDQVGSTLPNIVTLSKKEIPSGNSVKVLWYTPIESLYNQSSNFLWESPVSYLSAGGLKEDIVDSSTEFVMDISTLSPLQTQQSFYNFNGYVLIQSEIIEFDAIGYDYVDAETGLAQHVFITSDSDVNKYKSLSKQDFINLDDIAGSSFFKPSGRYRIKTRGALNTVKADHKISSADLKGWTGQTVSWK